MTPRQFQTAPLLAALALVTPPSAHAQSERILLQRRPDIAQGYDASSAEFFGSQLVAIRQRSARSDYATFFDAGTAQIAFGDLADPQANRIIDYSPSADAAIELDAAGNYFVRPRHPGATASQLPANSAIYETARFASDGKTIVVFGQRLSPAIVGIDSESGETSWNIGIPPGSETLLSPDRSSLLVITYGSSEPPADTLKVYDANSGELVRELQNGVLSSQFTSRKLSRSGRYATTYNYLNQVSAIVDLHDLSSVAIGSSLLLHFSPDERFCLLAHGSQWSVRRLSDHADVLTGTLSSNSLPNFGEPSGTVVYWDESTERVLVKNLVEDATLHQIDLSSATDSAQIFALSSDGKLLAALHDDSQLSIVDLDAKTLRARALPSTGYSSIRFSPDSSSLLLDSGFGAFSIFETASDAPGRILTRAPATAFATFSEENLLATADTAGRLAFLDPETLEVASKLRLPALQGAQNLRFSASGSPGDFVVAGIFPVSGAAVFEPPYATPRWSGFVPSAPNSLDRIWLSPIGRYLAAIELALVPGGAPQRRFKLIDTTTGANPISDDPIAPGPFEVVFSADEATLTLVETESFSVTLATYRLSDAQQLSYNQVVLQQSPAHLAISRDAQTAWFASNNTLTGVATATGQILASIQIPANQNISSLALSPDGKLALLSTINESVLAFDLERKTLLGQATLAWKPANSFMLGANDQLVFLPDSRSFARLHGNGFISINQLLLGTPAPLSIAFVESAPAASLFAASGSVYRIESSTDLVHWSAADPLEGQPASDATVTLPANPSASSTFLRAWQFK